MGDPIGRPGVHLARKEQGARRGKRAREHGKGRKPHDQDNHEGAQITAAQPCQSAKAAGARQRHAIAEDQPAKDRRRPREGNRQVKGAVEVDQPQASKRETTQHRHADSQTPHPHPVARSAIEHVFDRAEGAKPPQSCGEAQQHAAQPAQKGGGQRLAPKLNHPCRTIRRPVPASYAGGRRPAGNRSSCHRGAA